MTRGKFMMVRGTRNNSESEQNLNERYEKTVHELSQLLIEQMKLKLEQQNRKIIKQLEEVECLAEKYINDSKAEKQIAIWREEYRRSQDSKDNTIINKIKTFLRNWSA